jgi:D-glycero-alpha-D-manno-heptose 1-phosphate guanylyltransferase
MEAIVLAGGLGTRLAAKLGGIPKAMAPVAGRPFLEILLGRLSRAGYTRALLSVGHLHQVIQDRFGATFRGISLDYVIENSPLGTGGAIRLALSQASEGNVLVLNGDTFLEADYAAMMRFHAAQSVSMTIAVTRQPDIARYGGVLVEENRIVGFQEKGRSGPGLINAGAYVIDKNLPWPQTLPERFSFEMDFLAPQITRFAPAAFEVDGFFLDIGIPEDLARAQNDLVRFKP